MPETPLNLATLSPLFADEAKAREFLEAQRWPDGPVCPRCNCEKIYKITPKPGSKGPVRPGVYKCSACRKQFTVRIGTIFEESLIPLNKWLMAIHLLCSSKKGISSSQIAREIGVTVKSAWFITHRIREAMREGAFDGLLEGMVEVDETYVGGKPRKGTGKHKRGRGTAKQPVMVLVQRGGKARCKPVEAVDGKTLKSEVKKHVADAAVVMTDELASYTGLKETHPEHHVVKHSGGEFAKSREDGLRIHTNTAESFFALLKRGHYGVYHFMSRRHMRRYCDEFEFRWNHRMKTDGSRMLEAIKGAEGKRLMYRIPKGIHSTVASLVEPGSNAQIERIHEEDVPF